MNIRISKKIPFEIIGKGMLWELHKNCTKRTDSKNNPPTRCLIRLYLN